MYTYLVGYWRGGPEGIAPGDRVVDSLVPIEDEEDIDGLRALLRKWTGLSEESVIVISAITRLPPGGPYEEG